MSKIRYSLAGILFYVIIVMVCFLLENDAFLTGGDYNDGLDLTSFYLITIALIATMIVYFVVEHKHNQIHTSIPFVIILVLCFILFDFMVWIDKPEYGIELDIATKLQYSITLALGLVGIYIACFYQTKRRTRGGGLQWFAYIILVYLLITIIYSLINEWDIYKSVLDASTSFVGNAKSIYPSHNIYGLTLLIGILLLALCNYHQSNFIYYILMLVLYLCIFFTRSGGALMSSTFFLFVYFIIRYIKYTKNHHKGGLVVFLVVIALALAFVIVDAILTSQGHTFINNALMSLFNEIDIGSNSTLTGRTAIWDNLYSVLESNPLYLIFGLGYRGTQSVTPFFGYKFESAHNAFLQVMVDSGLVGLALYVSMLIYTFYCCIRLMKRGKVEYGLTFIVMILALMLDGVVESTVIFGLNSLGIIMGFFFILSPIISWHRLKHPERVEVVAIEKPVPYEENRLQRFFTGVVWGFTICAACLFMFNYVNGGDNPEFAKLCFYIFICLVISALFLPTIITGMLRGKCSQRLKTTRAVLLSFLIVIVALVFGYAFTYINEDYFLLGFTIGYGISTLIIAFIFSLTIGHIGSQFVNFFKGITITERFAFIVQIVVELLIYLILTYAFSYEWSILSILIVSVIGLLSYFATFFLKPSHEVNRTLEYFNDWQINANLKYHEKRYDI
ncbi:MAG: O-antigen ligase family protein [Coprobacillus sp.]|nr:O-antigen ligase family protein [Coprobacillus sp.]